MSSLQKAGYSRIASESGVALHRHTDGTYVVFFDALSTKFKPFYRKPAETFRTACNREIQNAKVVCNGPYFTIKRAAYYTQYAASAHVDGGSITQDGRVYINGALQTDSRSSGLMFYVNQSSGGQFTFGEGNPPSGAYNAIGDLSPLILGAYRPSSNIRSPIKFGEANLYDGNEETSLPLPTTISPAPGAPIPSIPLPPSIPVGAPLTMHEDNLVQRSFKRAQGLGAGQGMTALGLNSAHNLLVLLVRDNGVASGAAEHEVKSAVEHFTAFGCNDAVGFDVSTSCTMRTKQKYYVTPDDRKNNSIEVGFSLS